MAQDNIETVRAAYAAFNRGDVEAALESADPDIEWMRVEGGPESEPVVGIEALRDYMKPDLFEEMHSEPHEIIERGNRILVRTLTRARGAGSGIEVAQEGYHLWTVRDGKAIRYEPFLDREPAMAALEEGP